MPFVSPIRSPCKRAARKWSPKITETLFTYSWSHSQNWSLWIMPTLVQKEKKETSEMHHQERFLGRACYQVICPLLSATAPCIPILLSLETFSPQGFINPWRHQLSRSHSPGLHTLWLWTEWHWILTEITGQMSSLDTHGVCAPLQAVSSLAASLYLIPEAGNGGSYPDTALRVWGFQHPEVIGTSLSAGI